MLKENLNNLLSKPWETMPLELTQKIASQLLDLSEEIKEMVVVVDRVNSIFVSFNSIFRCLYFLDLRHFMLSLLFMYFNKTLNLIFDV